jgi:hypothetical protein
MKKVIRLTEQDLVTILKDILSGVMPNLKDLKFLSNNTSDEDSEDIKKLDTNIPNKTTSDDEFYKRVLECIGAKPTKGNMAFMNAWRQAEGSTADFNPFNTTKNLPGSTAYNYAKVKNYKSAEDGIKATCDTLKLSYYTDIVNGLKNDVGLYKLSRMEGLKKWGTGELLAKVADGYLAGASPKPKPIDTGLS